jgi:LemA protein
MSPLIIALLVGVGVLVVLALFIIGKYNGLVALRNRFKNAWAQIDVQLKRRYDLIPNLVETTKGYLKHERGTLEAVIAARNSALSANNRVSGNPGDPEAMKALSSAEGSLGGALGRLFALTEAYPDLKAVGNVSQLQEEIASTENRIAFSRQHYNDVATNYNVAQEQFPTNLVAGLAKATPAELWEIEDPGERNVPKVDLSIR